MILQDDVNKWRFNVYIDAVCCGYNIKTVHKIFSKIGNILKLS